MRLTLGLSLAAILAAADPAGAVLKHYGVHWTAISNFNTAPPPYPSKFPPAKDGSTPVSVGIVDDTNNRARSAEAAAPLEISERTTAPRAARVTVTQSGLRRCGHTCQSRREPESHHHSPGRARHGLDPSEGRRGPIVVASSSIFGAGRSDRYDLSNDGVQVRTP